MTPENFVYWLNGFFELGGGKELSAEQVEMVKAHLALVMKREVTVPGPAQFQDINPLKIDFTQGPTCSAGPLDCVSTKTVC